MCVLNRGFKRAPLAQFPRGYGFESLSGQICRSALLSDDVTIREATPNDATGIAEVHVRSWQTTYAGILPQEHIDRRTVAVRTSKWNEILRVGEQYIFVACDPAGTIVGFASGGASSEPVDGFDAEIGTIYILPGAQGRGIGKRLLGAISEALRAEGFQAVWVRVLSDNRSAREFYEKCGAEVVCETEEEIDGFVYREHFYGWRDLAKL